MTNLKLTMSQGNKNASLEIEQANDEQKLTVIERLMRFFGVRQAEEVKPSVVQVAAPKVELIQKREEHREDRKIQRQPSAVTIPLEPVKQVEQSGSPKQLPLIGSERTMHTEIRELISENPGKTIPRQEGNGEPEWYKTGIKYRDGEPQYKCRVHCKNPECQRKTNAYVPVDQLQIECHDCGTALTIRPAAPKGERDGNGNFFIADDLVRAADEG
ncbi:hypothetical protein [Paenibacillus sp. 22594]|uniref:hypothetical protein n=1 Tax=Paenibacillus sp. 22594 TaxID=3453947 RepID=UPI003F87E935